MQNDKCREEFEKWANNNGFLLLSDYANLDNDKEIMKTQSAYKGWCAGYEAALKFKKVKDEKNNF